MKFESFGFLVWIVYSDLVFGFTNSYLPAGEYDRINEVKKECASVLSSAPEFKLERSRVSTIREELSFVNADWIQEGGKYPIMPFDERQSPGVFSEDLSPLKLASFWVSDVDSFHRSKKSINVNGGLLIGITRAGSFADTEYVDNPQFHIWPSHSKLLISFQGIYTESKKNGGERILCLLGNTMLPTRESDPANPWEWMKESSSKHHDELPLSEDDRILLVLRYPMTFTLTNRAIHGELSSLNPVSNPKYFDMIHISSQLGESADYEFGSENVVSKACLPYPYRENLTSSDIKIYRGLRFCEILEEITREQSFTVVPNWRCNGSDDFCRKLGPFESDKEIRATDGSFRDVKLSMQNVKCKQLFIRGNASSYRVSAVFRAVSPSENQYAASKRSGLNNMTLAAEGIWKSSDGQLCMIGCLGFVDSEGSGCDSRICLYVPTSFSIRQHSILFGSIFPIKNSSAYFPLSFEKLMQSTELWNYFNSSHPYYIYSKLDLAGAILERNEAFSFETVVKKSILAFPKLEDTEAFEVSLSYLSEDLSFHVSGIPDSTIPGTHAISIDIEMEILSVGPLFGQYWFRSNYSNLDKESPYLTKSEYTEKQLLVNVSAQLSLTGKPYSNFSVLFLEGLYDPHVGKMYLVGCRDVRASWKILFDSMDLESGLDCQIGVVVAYPPTTARWLVNPAATISIASQRNEDDPLHFSSMNLQTFPVVYRKQREDILSRKGVEGILRILTLSLAIGCISSQLFHIKHNMDTLPFISLVMLGIQALGYAANLVTGGEALFKTITWDSYETSSDNLESNQRFRLIDYTIKLLVMVSLLLTLRLCQKVWKSRTRLLTPSSLEPNRVPNDKRIFIFTLTIHVIGYVTTLIIHGAKTSPRTDKYYVRENSHIVQVWGTELEEYAGLIQDFFLLPQVIGNFVWQIECKPLRKFYFIGITVVRLLPHIYDLIKSPTPNPYVAVDYEFVDPKLDFYLKFGDITIPIIAILLASTVHIQQRWSYEKLGEVLKFRGHNLLPRRFKVYERLPNKVSESELVSGVNGNNASEQVHGDVE